MPHVAFETWLKPTPSGLYCVPGDFFIDPPRAVERAVITHGHSDHAHSGHTKVLATAETLAVMRLRLGAGAGQRQQPLDYGEAIGIGGVTVSLHPAGHVLGSAQVRMEYRGARVVVTGDYKRRSDPTARAFEVVGCDLLVSEATFGLPVFRHEPDDREIARLLASHSTFHDRAHLIGAYGLGKCQRLIALLRQAGYHRPIHLHTALAGMCQLYQELGIELGALTRIADDPGRDDRFAGEIVIAPPSTLADRWSRRLAEPVTAFASGWMRVKARARQRGVELPLVISDHADWPELIGTIQDCGAQEVWVTHGREDALVRQCSLMGLDARALRLVGREEEAE